MFHRLIVLAASPHIVIQVNATFLRFTGTSSSSMLGQQLHFLLEDDSLLKSLTESAKRFTSNVVPYESSVFKRPGNLNNLKDGRDLVAPHKIVITPVGSQKNSITHFAIEIQGSEQNLSQECGDYDQLNRSRLSGQSMKVIA